MREAMKKAQAKPPQGFTSTPKSTVGSYRKKMPNGGYVYWRPGKDGKGKFSTEKEKGETSKFKSAVLAALEEVLPPERHGLLIKFSELLDKEEGKDSTKEEGGEAAPIPEGGVEGAEGGEEKKEEEEKHPEPAENKKIREKLDKEKAELEHKIEKVEMERDLETVEAVAGAFAKLVASEKSGERLKTAEDAVMKQWGPKKGTSKKSLFQDLVDELLKARAAKSVKKVST